MSARTFPSKGATEHAFPENDVKAARTTATVELLLSSVIDARDAHGGQLGRDYLEREITVLRVSAEAHVASAFAHLVVIINQRDNLAPVPAMLCRVVQRSILEQREVVLRVSQTANHSFKFTGDVLNA